MLIRGAEARDADALAALYGHHVLHGVGTFEEVPPSVKEMAGRIAAVQALGLPYVVAEVEGAVQAFAYASPFRLRAAYRYTVEDSVYVAADRRGGGLGQAVLRAVIDACERLDLRQMVALIGGADNAASIGLHRACGFVPAGALNAVGFKAGAWADVVIMQRPLAAGAGGGPATPGLGLIGG
jgi:L-amino acid N-acyltransferase YncA